LKSATASLGVLGWPVSF